MRSEPWLAPALLIVTLQVAVAVIAGGSDILVSALGLWGLICLVAVGLVVIYVVVGMMLRGEESPIAKLRSTPRVPIILAGLLLAGVNMGAFMQLKPMLNVWFPFWADPLLASVELRIDWSFFNHHAWALFYHRAWFLLLILALIQALFEKRSALLLAYFAIWAFVGPIGHALLPAGGPIFYERIVGDPYAVIPIAAEQADYLWQSYTSGTFGPGAGISAMPSLHIATTVWFCLVFSGWLRWVAYVSGALIFVLSVALGWHYWLDGAVGGAMALAVVWASRKAIETGSQPDMRPAKA